MEFVHKSVLLEESVQWVVTDPKGIYVDCTLGGAGHSHRITELLDPEGLLIGIDQDEDAIAAATERLKDAQCQVKIVHNNFRNLDRILDQLGIPQVDGILFDLGVSSYQLDTPERGFSYMHDGPLDMRMDQEASLTAEQVVNRYKEDDLAGQTSSCPVSGSVGLSAGWELGLSAQPVSSAALSAKQSKARIQKRFIDFPLLPRRAGDLVAEIAPLIIVHQCQIGLAPVQGHLLAGFGVELERMGGMRLLPAAHLHAAPCEEVRLPTGHIVDRLDIVRIARIGGDIGKADHYVVKG